MYNKNHSRETKEKISKINRKYTYTFTSPENIIYETDNLSDFCDIYGFQRYSMERLASKGSFKKGLLKNWIGKKVLL